MIGKRQRRRPHLNKHQLIAITSFCTACFLPPPKHFQKQHICCAAQTEKIEVLNKCHVSFRMIPCLSNHGTKRAQSIPILPRGHISIAHSLLHPQIRRFAERLLQTAASGGVPVRCVLIKYHIKSLCFVVCAYNPQPTNKSGTRCHSETFSYTIVTFRDMLKYICITYKFTQNIITCSQIFTLDKP